MFPEMRTERVEAIGRDVFETAPTSLATRLTVFRDRDALARQAVNRLDLGKLCHGPSREIIHTTAMPTANPNSVATHIGGASIMRA